MYDTIIGKQLHMIPGNSRRVGLGSDPQPESPQGGAKLGGMLPGAELTGGVSKEQEQWSTPF